MGEILVGTSSWADPTLIRSKRFYPEWAKSAESRLQYYASQFPLVEVDSSYYALLEERTSRLWVERTQDKFVFDVKSFRLFTQHPTPLAALPKDIRQALPEEAAQKRNIYLRDVPQELLDELWRRFERSLLPLDSAGKLGVVFAPVSALVLSRQRAAKLYLVVQEEAAPVSDGGGIPPQLLGQREESGAYLWLPYRERPGLRLRR